MRDRPEGGARHPGTKELILALLVGANRGAEAHAANAIRLGPSLEERAEGLVQSPVVGGITTRNRTGQAVMECCAAVAVERAGT